MGGLDASEEAILRNQAATGGLRSGDTQDALARNAEELQRQALLTSYNEQLGGIQGLAGLPSNANQIAATTSEVGQTLAQGQTAAAQAIAQGQQAQQSNVLGLASLGLSAFSDERLKENIVKTGEFKGLNVYFYDWAEPAKQFGLEGSSEGFLAHEVESAYPDLVCTVNGYKCINYGAILHG